MNEKENLKRIIEIFIDKWDNSSVFWSKDLLNDLKPTYKGYKLKISFGMGRRIALPKYPYIAFLKYNQKVSRGIYPFITYHHDDKTLNVGLGVSWEHKPNIKEKQLQEIEAYKEKSFTVENIDLLINELDKDIKEFERIYNAKNNEEETTMQTKNIILYGPPGVEKHIIIKNSSLSSKKDEGKKRFLMVLKIMI